MAILPRFLATTPPPRESGMARATDIGALTRTGDIEVWRGVSRMGGAMQDVGRTLFAINQEKQRLDDNLQTAKKTASAKKEAQGLWDAIKTMEIPTDKMGTTIAQDATTTFQDAITAEMKDASPRVKYNLEMYETEAVPAFARETKKLTESIWKEYHLVEEEKLITALVAEGRYEEAEARIDKLDTSNLITHKTAVTMKRDLIEQQKLLLAINLAGATLLPEHIKAASKLIEKSKEFATEDEKAFFRGQLNSVVGNARSLQNDQTKAANSQIRKEATDRMLDDTLTVDWLRKNRDSFADDDYERFNKYLLARKVQTAEEARKAEEKATDEATAQEVLRQRWDLISDVTDMIDDVRGGKGDPIAVKTKIDEMAKLGNAGIADAEQYRAKLSTAMQVQKDPKSPLNKPIVKRGLVTLGEIKNMRMTLLKANDASEAELLEELRLGFRLKNDFEQYVLAEDRTDDQIEAKIESLTTPIVVEAKRHWFGGLMRNIFGLTRPEEEVRGLYGLEPKMSEPNTQAEFETQVKNIEDREAARTYYNKWAHKWQ